MKNFEISETEKISIGLKAEDPDADKLAYTFSAPLDKSGEWQTTYGDAGEYESTITVTDGKETISENVSIIVHKKEEKPSIDSASPEEGYVGVEEGSTILFESVASDLNQDELKFEWLVDGKPVSENNEMVFEADYSDAGKYKVQLIVSDGKYDAMREWNVEVKDVNLDALIDGIKGIEISETETAMLQLPDFSKYALAYTISEPLGSDNKWETGYNDAGSYDAILTVGGKGFEAEKEIRIVVKNKDRKPQLQVIRELTINENEKATIKVESSDPDGDKVALSAEDIPEGASFEEPLFTWTPGFDFVQKSNIVNSLLDKFRMLSKSKEIIFKAESNGMIEEKKVKITVRDVNLPFILENIPDVEVNEGQDVVIEPKYNDPDNDKVSFSYIGFMDSNRKKTGFDDAGMYIIRIEATDGIYTQTRFVNVKVNDANRKPAFDNAMKGTYEVFEGQELKIELNAKDADNDAVSFSATGIPEDAKLKDNLFAWKPGFDIVNGTKKEFSINFMVSDGKEKDEKKVKAVVSNINQAPIIASASDTLIAVKGKPALFEVNASDNDGDALTYQWIFGRFDKYKGENKHQRVFTASGKKKVELVVSDGIESVSKVWNVEVV